MPACMKANRPRAVTMSLAILLVGVPGLAAQQDVTSLARDEVNELVALYQHLHRHPELSLREKQTSARMAEELRRVGVEVTERVGGYGVVGLLRNGDGKTLMLRADMDALPIAEETGLPYASAIRGESDEGRPVGIMHACGHDLHMTNLVGTVRWLAANKTRWRGTLLVVFQPAEEGGLGAKAMLADKLFERFVRPDFALALHTAHDLQTGAVGVRAGWAMANADSVDIIVFGRGGHGSMPHLTIDPITLAAYLITDLQTIVSRELPANEPAVVSVGAIHAGSKHNIIPDRCELQLTVRSYAEATRAHIHAAIRRKCSALAAAHRAPEPELTFKDGTPALFNHAGLVARVVPVLERALGAANVVEIAPVMGAEDFARYGLAGVPAFMFRLGTVAPARLAQMAAQGELPPTLHSARYYPDAEESLRTGIAAMTAAAVELLQ